MCSLIHGNHCSKRPGSIRNSQKLRNKMEAVRRWKDWRKKEMLIRNDEDDNKLRFRKMKSKGNKKRKLIDSPYESDIYSHCLWKTCLIRKYIHSDIVFSMMKYHQSLLKSLNNWCY